MGDGKGEVRKMRRERREKGPKIHRCGGRIRHGTLKTRPQVVGSINLKKSPF